MELLKTKKLFEEKFGSFSPEKLKNELESLSKKIESLEENLSTYTSILDEMPVGVILVNDSGKITFTNRMANKHFLSSPSKTRKAPLSPLSFTMEISQSINEALTGDEKIIEIETKRTPKKVIRSHIKPLLKEGKPHGALVVLEDITEVRKFEKLKQGLISDFSHELRTPLTSLKTSIETLVDFKGLENPSQTKKFLGYIKREVNNLSELVEKMMQLARLESSGEAVLIKSKFKIKDVIKKAIEAVQVQAEKKAISLVVKCENNLILEGDKNLITQALINLLDNAIKFSPSQKEVTVSALKKGNKALISIKDLGPGLPKKEIPKIFRRFYRSEKHRSRSTGGFGLGLSLVKHIMEAHNGEIKVKSKVNQGSEFIISLPLLK